MILDLNRPDIMVTDVFQYQTPSENSGLVRLDSHILRESKIYEEALKGTPPTQQKIKKSAFQQ